jgi:prolyl oligopeptidase
MALPTVGTLAVREGRLFVLERPAGADQFLLTVRSADDAAEPARTLLDPATASADGASAIDWYAPSPDGSLIAVGVSEGGTERSTLRIIDVATGETLPDAIPDTRAASVAWLPDNSAFYYACYPAGDEYNRHIRFHVIGDDIANDTVAFDRLPTPESWPDVQISPDGAYLLVEMMVGWGRIDAHLQHRATGEWRTVVEGVQAISRLRFHPSGLVATTSVDAPNGRLIRASFDAPAEWTTVVAERDVVLGEVTVCGDDIVVVASREAVDSVERWHLDGTLAATADGLGPVTVQALSANGDAVFMAITSFQSPARVVRWSGDSTGAETAATAEPQHWCPESPDPAVLPRLIVSHLKYPSLDGTMIGLFVAHRTDITPSATTPLILTGYGGFAIAESPLWMPNLAAWCAAGGVFAIAGLRGGYEHGEAWHHAGRRDTKQNVFDDFHAAADWLVANDYTSRDRLAIAGGSNGGLLVGVALTQRPDLASAVWCAVPLLDMIRFPQFLIARLWTDEYGDPDVAEEFGWVHAYSPYHHVVEGGDYPAVLFTTAEGDTRVDPLHARKMAALLTWASSTQGDHPVLLQQAGRAGHGAGKPASMRVDEGADVLTFLAWQLAAEATA